MGMAITTVDTHTHTHTTTMLTSEVSERVRALFSVRIWRRLVMVMAFSLVACGSGGGSKEASGGSSGGDSGSADEASELDLEKEVKIGVLVSDATSAEALGRRSYLEKYIQSQYKATFVYSDELKDAAGEKSAIDTMITNNCKAIISESSFDRPAQIEQCESTGVYYAVATGTLTDEQYEQFKGYEHYVGAIGPDLLTEYMAG